MFKFVKSKRKKLLKEAYDDIRRSYKNGISLKDIAKEYSLEIEYINLIALSKTNKILPEYHEWRFNYLITLWENNIDIETIKKLCPVNEKYYSHNMLEWEILNMNKYKNFKEWRAAHEGR